MRQNHARIIRWYDPRDRAPSPRSAALRAFSSLFWPAARQMPTAALFLWARLMKYNEKLSPHVRGLLLEENYLCISAGRWGCPI